MDNLRGATLMVLAMFGFAIEDAFVKILAIDLPAWEIIASLGFVGALVFAVLVVLSGQPLLSRTYLAPAVIARNLLEGMATMCMIIALSRAPLVLVSAIMQAAPLLVTMGAALFLGETVGWRRWSAIFVGLVGVLIVLRPGLAGFNADALFAVVGVVGMAGRDLLTRIIPKETSSPQLSMLAFAALVPAGLILAVLDGSPFVMPQGVHVLPLAGMLVFAYLSYFAIVLAMRVGEVSFVTGFRYSRMLFALIIGTAIFAERPDAITLLGTALIVASGIYTFWRERNVRRQARRACERKHVAAA
ncbi:DMT family transporter [Chachezhania antarctica]|uniref:DMT family transporter n=1 Tax=Chachezhania antarctica TaxID=2340860 RepID=UPI000EB291E2|nr:DMT family transporter [Chachezhania antarctica]|tara:strand:+ start:1290 stop:2195 length:906 start_codon:yes stop_codon:yes gene_type:complete